MNKLFAVIGAITVLAAAAVAVSNFFYDISFTLNITKKKDALCDCDDDCCDCDDDCCCEEEESPVAEVIEAVEEAAEEIAE